MKGVKGVTTEELQEYIEGRHSTDYGTCKSIEFLKDPEGLHLIIHICIFADQHNIMLVCINV